MPVGRSCNVSFGEEKGIQCSEPSSDVQQRILNLNSFFTYSVYKNVCRSLFENHKLLFSFLLTMKILEGQKEVDPVEWRFLISGTSLGPRQSALSLYLFAILSLFD